jgi:ArsR family metal-binding transcriptional regulator
MFIDVQDNILEALPYLNAELGGLDYYHSDGILLWLHGEKRYAFRSHEIAITPVLEAQEAQKLADSIVKTINSIWKRREQIAPSFEGKKRPPNVLDIYKLLPRTNCKLCGFPSCMALATALRSDSTKSLLCPNLSEQDYKKLLWKEVISMWWQYGPPMGPFWFIFPFMAFIFMLVMLFVIFQFMRGRGGMCGGFRRDDDEVSALRREIRELRNEIEELRKSKGA